MRHLTFVLCAATLTAQTFSPKTDLSVSATQAVLTFRDVATPANCRLEVSESPTFTPLVYSMDPALYPQANEPTWTRSDACIFMVGKRTYAQAFDGNSYSLALAHATAHYWRLTGTGIGTITGSFITQAPAFGVTFGEPLPMSGPAQYAYPTIPATLGGAFIDAQTGAKLKKVTAGGSGWFPAGGRSCHTTAVAGGYVCLNGDQVMWIGADGTVRNLGKIMDRSNRFSGSCAALMQHPVTPTVFFCETNQIGYGARTLYRMVVNIDGTAIDPANAYANGGMPRCSEHNVSPCISSEVNLFGTGNTGYNDQIILPALNAHTDAVNMSIWPSGLGCSITSIALNNISGHVDAYAGCAALQNIAHVMVVIDLGNEQPMTSGGNAAVIAARTTWSAKGCRWCGNHGGGIVGAPEAKPYISWMSYPLGLAEYSGDRGGPYKTTLDTPLTATTGSCAAYSSNPIITAYIASGVLSGVPSGGLNAIGCDVRTVQGHFCDSSPGTINTGAETTLLNANPSMHLAKCGRSGAYWLQDMQAGDYAVMPDNTGEQVEIIDTSAFPQIVLLRGHMYCDPGLSSSTYDGGYKGPQAHTSATLYAWYNSQNNNYWAKSGGLLWSYTDDPWPTPAHDAMTKSANQPGTHAFSGYYVQAMPDARQAAAGCVYGCTGIKSGTLEARISSPTAYTGYLSLDWTFEGLTTSPVGTDYVDTHPSPPPESIDIPTPKLSWYVDGRIIKAGINGPGTLVGGQLWKWTWAAFKPKKLDWFASGAGLPIKDVSPAVLGTTSADAGKGCYVVNAGDCYAGSAPGEFYINASNVTQTQSALYCCGNLPTNRTDIMFGVASASGMSYTQGIIRGFDRNGGQTRVLTRGLMRYNKFQTFENFRLTPDGQVGMFYVTGADGSHNDVFAMPMPPIITDTTDRTQLILAKQVTGLRVLGARTRVKFGYSDYGSLTSYQCRPRATPCYAVSSTLNHTTPFLWSDELTASNGDTATSFSIAVPLHPTTGGRVVYWMVETIDASGNVVATDGPYAKAVL